VRKYVVEFIGTFFLVLTVSCAVLAGAPLAPLGIAAVLTAMVFAGGHISGAHYNPAVSLAVYFRGRLAARDLLPYLAAQLAGGVLGALLGRWVSQPGPGSQALEPSGRRLVAALVVELLVTFALAYVVLNVATSGDHPGNSFYGLAIGFTVLAGAVSVGGISGGVFNPAVGLGAAAAGILSWSIVPAYLLVMVVAGTLAGFAFRALNPDDLAAPAAAPPVASDTARERAER
jgi:aquaporin Z